VSSHGDPEPRSGPPAPGAPAGADGDARNAAARLRDPAYVRLLVVTAVLGVPISAAAYGFLALVNYLQKELFTHLPHGLGFATAPAWWPVPMLLIGGVLTGLAIRYLPGGGGPSPAPGFALHGPPSAAQLPGVLAAALATLAFGAVLGPEMPLIALGGGLGVLATRLARRKVPEQGVRVIGAAGSFAAISTLFGSPIAGAFLLMEASGLGGPMMSLVLVPGLVASGIGALIFIGLHSLTGLGTFSLALPSLPYFSRPDVAEFGWAVVIGLAAAVIGPAIHRLGLFLHGYAVKCPLLMASLAGLVVALLTVGYTEATGKPAFDVLFSGQDSMGTLVAQAGSYSAGALVLLLACKGLAYAVSLSSLRGGPVFPALFIGAAGGMALSHLPGLPLVAGIAMGIGAMSVVMLTLPLTSVLLATLLLGSDAVAATPLIIVAVAVAYVAAARLTPASLGVSLAWRKSVNDILGLLESDAGIQPPIALDCRDLPALLDQDQHLRGRNRGCLADSHGVAVR
jgi:H+/Cl- antiporter ClcA